MHEKDITERLKLAVQEATPDVFSHILTSLDAKERTAALLDIQDKPRKRTSPVMKRLAAAAAVLLVLVTGGWAAFSRYNAVATVELDVNPCITLRTNRKNAIVAADGMNPEAQTLLSKLDLKNKSIDTGVKSVFLSLLAEHYIDENQNSVLVSIANSNEKRGAQLQQKMVSQVQTVLHSNHVEAAVISQVIPSDKRVQELAAQNGISLGKATLIDKMVSQDGNLNFKDVAKLSINDISLIAQTKNLELNGISFSGSTNSGNYIGEDSAKAIASTHAGVPLLQWKNASCTLDCRGGEMIYSLSFARGTQNFSYEIDAKSGAVVSHQNDVQQPTKPVTPSQANSGSGSTTSGTGSNTGSGTSTVSPTGSTSGTGSGTKRTNNVFSPLIGLARATEIALTHAKALVGAYGLSVDASKEDGKEIYTVTFKSDGKRYTYKIDAVSGRVLDWLAEQLEPESTKKPPATKRETTTKKPEPPTQKPTTTKQNTTRGLISAGKAKEIALNHAKLKEKDVSKLDVELDRRFFGVLYQYEVVFSYQGKKYQYDIDAYNGYIIDSQVE